MGPDTKVIGKTTKQMVWVDLFMLMGMSMKENGPRTRQMEKESQGVAAEAADNNNPTNVTTAEPWT